MFRSNWWIYNWITIVCIKYKQNFEAYVPAIILTWTRCCWRLSKLYHLKSRLLLILPFSDGVQCLLVQEGSLQVVTDSSQGLHFPQDNTYEFEFGTMNEFYPGHAVYSLYIISIRMHPVFVFTLLINITCVHYVILSLLKHVNSCEVLRVITIPVMHAV